MTGGKCGGGTNCPSGKSEPAQLWKEIGWCGWVLQHSTCRHCTPKSLLFSNLHFTPFSSLFLLAAHSSCYDLSLLYSNGTLSRPLLGSHSVVCLFLPFGRVTDWATLTTSHQYPNKIIVSSISSLAEWSSQCSESPPRSSHTMDRDTCATM